MSPPILIKARRAIRRHLPQLAAAAVTSLAFFLLFWGLIRSEASKIEADNRTEAVNFGSVLRSQVDRELNALLFISGGLASYLNVYHENLDAEKIRAILADLHARSSHVRNLAVAVGYRITHVHPVQGNQRVIGLDYRDLPAQWPLVRQAVETRKGVLAGPLDLVQGGRGLVYRYPVYIEGKYWGILSTVIDTDSFLRAAFADVTAKDYAFAIRTREPDGRPGQVFYGRAELFARPGAFLMESEVPNGTWEWAIVGNGKSHASLLLALKLMAAAISVLLAGVVYFFLWERKKLAADALHDSLTGLANRRLLQDRMGQALAQGKRFGRPMAVLYIDLDHFKRLNDTYGHHFGDELLKVVARRLSGCIRNVDTLSRVGGDEFVLVLEEIGRPQDARRVAENILAVFREPALVLDIRVQINLSIGVAVYDPGETLSMKELTKRADMALYEAKGAGRNGYRLFGQPA